MSWHFLYPLPCHFKAFFYEERQARKIWLGFHFLQTVPAVSLLSGLHYKWHSFGNLHQSFHVIASKVFVEEPRRPVHSCNICILKRSLFWQNPSCALNSSIVVVARSLPLSGSICPKWASTPVLFDRHCVYLDFQLVICLVGSHLRWVQDQTQICGSCSIFSSFGESRSDACSFWFSDRQAETRSRIVLNTHKLEATTIPIDSQMIGTWQSVLSKNC